MNTEDYSPSNEPFYRPPSLPNRWILSRAHRVLLGLKDALEDYRFNDGAHVVYQFLWHELCDWYIECIKKDLSGKDHEKRKATQEILLTVLALALQLLHPFMPFITEEIWQALPNTSGSIMASQLPTETDSWRDEEAEREMGLIMEAIKGIRNIKGEMKISPGRWVDAFIACKDQNVASLIGEHEGMIMELAKVKTLKVGIDRQGMRPKDSATYVSKEMEIFVPMGDLIDKEEERKRLEKELIKVQKDLEKSKRKLSTEEFLQRAPEGVVEKERRKSEELTSKMERLIEGIKRLEA
jgi:valyl-tRNA synthetase